MDLSRMSAHTPTAVDDADKRAAVLAPVLTREGEAYILFTKRAEHLGEHPGQMSFPGGSREPEDGSLEATALREADEEIGLRAAEVTVAGRLDDIRTRSGRSSAGSPTASTTPTTGRSRRWSHSRFPS